MAIVYKGRVISVEVDERRFPDGRRRRVEIVRHAPVVVMLPIEADGRVVLVKQYRVSIDRETWEVPAGGIEPDEAAEAAVRRECEEEIRRIPRQVTRIGAWYPSPGFCDELMIFFRVTDLCEPSPDSAQRPDEDENITARSVTLEEAREMVRRGEIVDLKSAYALTLI
jgi:ADP-ribose pyrophosphatase